MSTAVLALPLRDWSGPIDAALADQAVVALEAGRVVALPDLAFPLAPEETARLSAGMLPLGRKNISFDPRNGRVGAAGDDAPLVAGLLGRFAGSGEGLLRRLLPPYEGHLSAGRASLRPAEIKDRACSPRHDDKLLHVDAFPSRPTRGARILRLFTNLPLAGCAREWRVGEPFEAVAARFLPALPRPAPTRARVYATLGLTKGVQSGYDQMMLALHDRMKASAGYQRRSPGTPCSFPPASTWLCFTDQVPHAALSGRMTMEQTFHLPVEAMARPDTAPLRVLERLTGRTLA